MSIFSIKSIKPFEPETERSFLSNYFADVLISSRIIALLGASLFTLFIYLDQHIIPESKHIAFIIRVYIILPITLGTFAISFTPIFEKHFHLIEFSLCISMGVGVVAIIYFTEPSEYGYRSYYSGLLLVILGINTVARQLFRQAWISTLIIILAYEYTAIVKQGLLQGGLENMDTQVFINNNYFLLSVSALSVYYSYMAERQSRKDFRQQVTIQNEKKLVVQKNEEVLNQSEELHSINEKMLQKSKLIEEKYNEKKQSLLYAQSIQKASTPSSESLKNACGEHFVFHRAYDIVSGDFFWAKDRGDYTLYAVADCTGHGVPGAMLSMLGASFLQEITSQDNFKAKHSPALVLEELRKKIKQVLNQSSSNLSSRDGMDISIAIINKKSKILQFAGANNHGLVIRNKQVSELRAIKNPIGVYPKEKAFENVTFQLESGDMIYLFSDGYADQFGGKIGRKMKLPRFKSLLVDITELPIRQQAEKLDAFLLEWQNNHPQTDDIMVAGIRI